MGSGNTWQSAGAVSRLVLTFSQGTNRGPMALSDLLQRLRPVGAPGAAGPVAVPAEEEDATALELAPVFDALAPVLAECAAIRSAAERAGADEVTRARREADALLADAAARAPGERAGAATRVQRSGDAETEAVLAAAGAEAERLRAAGRQQLAELTDLVITNIRAGLVGAATTEAESEEPDPPIQVGADP